MQCCERVWGYFILISQSLLVSPDLHLCSLTLFACFSSSVKMSEKDYATTTGFDSPLGEKSVAAVEVVGEHGDKTTFVGDVDTVPLGSAVVPEDEDEYADPRLKDYPIPLVAKCVSLQNDPT